MQNADECTAVKTLRPRPVNLANFRSSKHPSRSNSPPKARKASCHAEVESHDVADFAWHSASMSTEEKEYVALVTH